MGQSCRGRGVRGGRSRRNRGQKQDSEEPGTSGKDGRLSAVEKPLKVSGS